MLYESSAEDLHDDHERWIAEGRMTRAQAARIEARERRRNRQEDLDKPALRTAGDGAGR